MGALPGSARTQLLGAQCPGQIKARRLLIRARRSDIKPGQVGVPFGGLGGAPTQKGPGQTLCMPYYTMLKYDTLLNKSVSTWDLEAGYLCNRDNLINLTICSRASTAKVPIVSLNPTGDFNTSDVRIDDNGSPSWNKTIRIGIGSNGEIALDTEEKVEPEFCIILSCTQGHQTHVSFHSLFCHWFTLNSPEGCTTTKQAKSKRWRHRMAQRHSNPQHILLIMLHTLCNRI